MPDDFPWDDYEVTTDFPEPFKFVNPGDHIAGTITKIRTTDFGGTQERVPELWITTDDGTSHAVAASNINLRQKLAAERPRKGDRIAIVYTGNGERTKPGFNPPKLYDVNIKPADTTPTSAADLI